MADDAHDVGLISLIIESVAHRFTVNGQTFVLLGIGIVPALQGLVESLGIDADQEISDDIFTGDHITAVFSTAAETLPGLGAKALSPIGDGLIAPHATQNGSSGNTQNGGQRVPSSLGATRIGDRSKEMG